MLEDKLIILMLILILIFFTLVILAFNINKQINILKEEIFEKDNEYLRIAQETNDINKEILKVNDKLIKMTINTLDKIALTLRENTNEK